MVSNTEEKGYNNSKKMLDSAYTLSKKGSSIHVFHGMLKVANNETNNYGTYQSLFRLLQIINTTYFERTDEDIE